MVAAVRTNMLNRPTNVIGPRLVEGIGTRGFDLVIGWAYVAVVHYKGELGAEERDARGVGRGCHDKGGGVIVEVCENVGDILVRCGWS